MNKVHPVLKAIHSPDVHDLSKAVFDVDRPFCILVQAMFGRADTDGYESFDFLLVNRLWVEEQDAKEQVIYGPHHVVEKYDYIGLRKYLESAAKEIEADSWEQCAKLLSRIGTWEFEGYQEFRG